ncbi:T9SS type A sorting domain-containing protein [Chryseobacterium terrae]|uniref:T9SS type A sorting domain-containing protein n=1 Tax=Chryseobacterium terrae TaxID=3163299 RepID=A0ABW8Y6G3_9FLAO
MMKTLIFPMLFLCFSGNAQITDAAPYCQGNQLLNYNMFKDIAIGGVTHSFGPEGDSFGDNSTYKYYNTLIFPDLQKNQNISVTLNVYAVNDGEPIYFALWIDYNKNNTFEESEIVMQNSNTTNAPLPVFGAPTAPITKTITIPGNVAEGVFRARLMRGQDPVFNAPYSSTFRLNPCPNPNEFGYGNTYDFDVKITNGSLSTGEIDLKSEVSVYPNPVKNNLNISNLKEKTDVVVYDMQGRQMLKTNVKPDSGINLSHLSPGVYIVNVRNSTVEKSIKIVKQ